MIIIKKLHRVKIVKYTNCCFKIYPMLIYINTFFLIVPFVYDIMVFKLQH